MICRVVLVWFVGAYLIANLTLAQSPTTVVKQPYATLQQALAATGQLSGSTGPRSVNWIEGGAKFSYIEGQQIIK